MIWASLPYFYFSKIQKLNSCGHLPKHLVCRVHLCAHAWYKNRIQAKPCHPRTISSVPCPSLISPCPSYPCSLTTMTMIMHMSCTTCTSTCTLCHSPSLVPLTLSSTHASPHSSHQTWPWPCPALTTMEKYLIGHCLGHPKLPWSFVHLPLPLSILVHLVNPMCLTPLKLAVPSLPKKNAEKIPKSSYVLVMPMSHPIFSICPFAPLTLSFKRASLPWSQPRPSRTNRSTTRP